MSEMLFGDFIVKFRDNASAFWCLTSVSTKIYEIDENKVVVVNNNISFTTLKEYVEKTKDMFAGEWYCGSVSIFFDSEQDINMLKIRYPELNG